MLARVDLLGQAVQLGIALCSDLPAKVVFHADRGGRGRFARANGITPSAGAHQNVLSLLTRSRS